jgi:hypothetical protein
VRFSERVPGPPSEWVERHKNVDGALGLATQTCDLKKHLSEEPTVECLRAFWTAKPVILIPAGRNSVRHFLLRERVVGADRQGLIAEAASKVLVDKRSLLLFAPEAGCDSPERESRFRRWLGRRYDRPAIPDALVRAIQKPIVEALRSSSEDARVWALLRGVREVLFEANGSGPPFRAQFLFIREDGLTGVTPISDADAEELAGWLSGVLSRGGEAELDGWEPTDTDHLSVRDYLTFTPLPLDEYSL